MSEPIDLAAQKIERGYQAAGLLENPAFKDALTNLIQRYVDAWMSGKTVEAREDAHRYVTLVNELRQDLASTMTTGDLTRKRIEALRGKTPTMWSAMSG